MSVDFNKIQTFLFKALDDEYIKKELDKNLSPLEQAKINAGLIVAALKFYHQELEQVAHQDEK